MLYGKSLIIDFLDDFLKKRTAIMSSLSLVSTLLPTVVSTPALFKCLPLYLPPKIFFKNMKYKKKFLEIFLGLGYHLYSKFRCAENCAGVVIFGVTVRCVDNNHNNSCCLHIVVVW